MDANNNKTATVTEVRGLNTNAARGTQGAPFMLTGALLHPGGWHAAPAPTMRLDNISRAIHAGVGDDLYVVQAGQTAVYADGTLTPLGMSLDLTGAVTLGRDLIYAPVPDVYLNRNFGAHTLRNAAQIPVWDGNGTAPEMYARAMELVKDGQFKKADGDTLALRIVPVRGPDAPTPTTYLWPTELSVSLPYEAQEVVVRLTFPANVYAKQGGGAWFFAGTNVSNVGVVTTNLTLSKSPKTTVISTDIMYLRPTTADYHNGRVYAASSLLTTYDPMADTAAKTTNSPGVRLWFSDVVANFSLTALPFFAQDYYLDIPFKISKNIVAVQSSGRYLYIFGEREVMLLSGNDDTSWSIESIGDSIGAVAAASVQRLQNTTIYLSDSGVSLLQGGQVADISADVRDLLERLDRSNLSSTVDFKRELYLLSDGNVTLVYHLREQGWTARSIDGEAQQLVYGGGTPYSIHNGKLYSLDSDELLTMTIGVGPFLLSDWSRRNQWRGLLAGLDTDAPGVTFEAMFRVTDLDEQGLPYTMHSKAGSTYSNEAGVTPVNLHLASEDGIELSAVLCEAVLTVTPTTATRRCMVRPPITVLNSNPREATSR